MKELILYLKNPCNKPSLKQGLVFKLKTILQLFLVEVLVAFIVTFPMDIIIRNFDITGTPRYFFLDSYSFFKTKVGLFIFFTLLSPLYEEILVRLSLPVHRSV